MNYYPESILVLTNEKFTSQDVFSKVKYDISTLKDINYLLDIISVHLNIIDFQLYTI
jgi:hypothetical protein